MQESSLERKGRETEAEMNRVLAVHAVSLGCPKTRVDTERLLGSLGPVEMVEDPAAAELVFVNTCGFIAPAVQESVETVLELADARLEGGGRPVLAVAGCLPARYGSELTRNRPEVDLWLPLSAMDHWPLMVAEALDRPQAASGRLQGRVAGSPPSYAYLKVSEGCDHACSFCAIPSIRGRLKSQPRAELLAEARELVAAGVRELVLVAQDLTAYGKDARPGSGEDLPALLEDLCSLGGLGWLRPMYLYPAGLTDSFLSRLAGLGPPLLPYFDIPLQHAHPDVLRRMGRPFASDPRRVVDRVRAYFPHAALRTSLIVGFPGETEAHYLALRDFVAQVGFHQLGVFPYWPEDGTPAAELPDQVPDEVKEERAADLMALQAELSEDRLEDMVGDEVDVLIDEPSPEWPGLFAGRTWFQAPEVDGQTYVSAPGGVELAPGKLVKARVESVTEYDLSVLVEGDS